MDSTKDNCESNIHDEELEDYTEILKRMRIDLSSTVGLDDIMETVYEKQPALIDGLLFTGIYIRPSSATSTVISPMVRLCPYRNIRMPPTR